LQWRARCRRHGLESRRHVASVRNRAQAVNASTGAYTKRSAMNPSSIVIE
jgi:hypothetical protein